MFVGGVRLGVWGVVLVVCVCVGAGGVVLCRCVCVGDLLICLPLSPVAALESMPPRLVHLGLYKIFVSIRGLCAHINNIL